jgi:uncharacterized protein YbcI
VFVEAASRAKDRSLVSAGRGDLVREVRTVIRVDARDALVAAVEKQIEGEVVAVLSDMDPATDMTVFAFVLRK